MLLAFTPKRDNGMLYGLVGEAEYGLSALNVRSRKAAPRCRFHARVGEDEETARSSRFSRFPVHDDANLRIHLESSESTPSKITDFNPCKWTECPCAELGSRFLPNSNPGLGKENLG